MNLVWLEDFLALARTGNFSRAAEDRFSSQPAFSRRIRALEKWIGADLIDRRTQPARLTEVGEWFREVAEELLTRVARIPGEADEVAQGSSVTLRIASTHALSFTFLPRWLLSFESKNTLGPMQLMSDVLQRCETLITNGQVQFVLSHSHPQAPGFLDLFPYRSVQIGNDRLIAVSRPDDTGQPLHGIHARHKGPIPVLQYTEESGLGRITRAVLKPRLSALPVEVVLTAHLASVLRTMALDGRGVAWLPRSLIEDDLHQQRLVAAASPDLDISLEIRLYRNQSFAGLAAESFWQAAVDC